MQIQQIGDIVLDQVTNQQIIYPNKSRKYLLPCLKDYGKEFATKLTDVCKVAVGIGDIVVKNRGFKHEKHLFILVDTSIAPQHFFEFINFVRTHEAYQNDYVFGNIQTSVLRMFIIKFPTKFYDAFETFKIGDYSKMFSKAEVDDYFNNHPAYRRVLIKDERYKVRFAKELNEMLGVNIKPEDIQGELDLPPQEKGEVFNTHLKH